MHRARHRLTSAIITLACALAVGAAPALAQTAARGAAAPAPSQAARSVELPRAAWLGTALGPASGGVAVMSVAPGSTAAAAGVRVGDILTEIDGTAVTTPPAAVAALRAKASGTPARLTVVRDGNRTELSATYAGRPVEQFESAATRLGAVAFGGGHLRDILVTPQTPAPGAPVVYFIPGVTCMSVETAATGGYPIQSMIAGLAARGIGFYRVEKPGMGDSRSPEPCSRTDFATEMAAFRAGYDQLVRVHGVDPRRIVLFGHSMGGLQAPLLVADGMQVGRMVTFGTLVTRWEEYLVDVFRWQPVLQGEPPAVADALADQIRPVVVGLMHDPGGAPAVAAANPQHAAMMREHLSWDGADSWMGRTNAYWRGVNGARAIQAWSKIDVPTLVLHGEKDLAVVDHRDEQRIAAIVNASRPGLARYVSLPDTAHDFSLTTGGGFNTRVTRELADWILATPG